MVTTSNLLKKYNVRPQKRFGQSFLIDPNIISKIVQKADVKETETVVEIGAGLGVMTTLLTARAGKVIALELDPVMVDILHEETKGIGNLEIVHTDVLKYDFRTALEKQSHDSGSRLKVVGNIPYNISSQILLRLIEFRNLISEAILMFQKEVADRIIAEPGGKDYGILSVLTAMYAEGTRALSVPATCFSPVPKVDSAALKLVFRKTPKIDLRDPNLFFAVIKAAFAKRRKTLFNNLKSASSFRISEPDLISVLAKTGIDGKRRGETLSAEEFGFLSNELAADAAVNSSQFAVNSKKR